MYIILFSYIIYIIFMSGVNDRIVWSRISCISHLQPFWITDIYTRLRLSRVESRDGKRFQLTHALRLRRSISATSSTSHMLRCILQGRRQKMHSPIRFPVEDNVDLILPLAVRAHQTSTFSHTHVIRCTFRFEKLLIAHVYTSRKADSCLEEPRYAQSLFNPKVTAWRHNWDDSCRRINLDRSVTAAARL